MFVKIKFLKCHYTLWCAAKIGKNVGKMLFNHRGHKEFTQRTQRFLRLVSRKASPENL